MDEYFVAEILYFIKKKKKKGNENDKKQFFLMETMKSGKKVHKNSK